MAADVGDDSLHDYISDLPDTILVSILSLLPLAEAARSSVLATRWRHLFPSTLVDFKAYAPGRDVVNAVNSILAAHPDARVRSFSTRWLYFPRGDSSVEGWLRELAGRGVQELSLSFRERWQTIPASLFACASSLKRLHASRCTFPDATKASAPLARLAEIDLFGVTISEESLHALLSQCTALEHLRMRSSKCHRIHVRSPSLKTLCGSGDFDELFIEYAPNLERLHGNYMYLRRRLHLKVAHAPKLEFLGYLGMGFHTIEIGETIFTENSFDVKTLMPSLKTLAVELSYTFEGYINWFMQLLKLFPCLETIYIRSDTYSNVRDAAPGSWDVLRSVPCIDNHLIKVVFEVYRDHEWQREMAKFLHGRSWFLKTMEFHCMDDAGSGIHLGEDWVREQQELLCFDSRASMDARFLFFKHPLVDNHQEVCHHDWYKIKYYHDLYEV